MRVLKFIILLITLMSCRASFVAAQPPQPQSGKCVIAGRVVVGETLLRDATVIATFEDPDPRQRTLSRQSPERFTFRAKTDVKVTLVIKAREKDE